MRAVVVIGAGVALLLALRKKKPVQAAPDGLSPYFRANGRCFVKPVPFPGEPELPVVELPCDVWAAEKAAFERQFFGEDD